MRTHERATAWLCAQMLHIMYHCSAAALGHFPSTCQPSRLCLVFAGLAAQSVPLYLSEIAPVGSRGALNIMFQLYITAGILSAQLIKLGKGSLSSHCSALLLMEPHAALFERNCCR